MALLTLFVLALVQAVTEFLPVSSSGHLLILREFKGVDGGLGLDVILHMGTLIALVVYYRVKLLEIAKNLLRWRKPKLFVNILVSSVPAVLAAVLWSNFFEDTVRTSQVAVVMLALLGLVFVLEKVILPKSNKHSYEELKWQQALVVGVAQAVALVPGTSRSGASIVGGRLVGLNNTQAADYAFLIGVPVIFGAGVKVLFDEEASNFVKSYPFDTLFGVAVAAIFGYFAIDFMLKIVKKSGLKWFGVYRIILAGLLLMAI